MQSKLTQIKQRVGARAAVVAVVGSSLIAVIAGTGIIVT